MLQQQQPLLSLSSMVQNRLYLFFIRLISHNRISGGVHVTAAVPTAGVLSGGEIIRILTDCVADAMAGPSNTFAGPLFSIFCSEGESEVENCNCRPPTQRLPIILCTCLCRSWSKTKSVVGESPDSSLNLVCTCFLPPLKSWSQRPAPSAPSHAHI